LILCLLVFLKMGTLTKSAYKLIMAFLISYPIINGLRQFMGGNIKMMLTPEAYTLSFIISVTIAITAFSGVWSIINYIYFSKRKDLFTEHPEIYDFVIDDGSVQLVHYDECPYCHTKTDGNSSFCENCGRNFTNSDDNRKE
ncbi:MAG: zinc ribbon domain-containing protein, partial [Ruminiclostridium sp.]